MATSIEDLTARAKTLIAERNYRDAVRACRRVLVARPSAVDVRLLLGMALLSLERFDEARAEMLAALRREPELAAAHRLLGEAYLRDGQPDKAAMSLRRSVELDPRDEAARDLLREVADEDKPSTDTLDRWFDPDAALTDPDAVPAWSPDPTALRQPSKPPATSIPPVPPSSRKPSSVPPPPVTPAGSAAMSSRPAAYRGRTVQRPRPRRSGQGADAREHLPAPNRKADRKPSFDWMSAKPAVPPPEADAGHLASPATPPRESLPATAVPVHEERAFEEMAPASPPPPAESPFASARVPAAEVPWDVGGAPLPVPPPAPVTPGVDVPSSFVSLGGPMHAWEGEASNSTQDTDPVPPPKTPSQLRPEAHPVAAGRKAPARWFPFVAGIVVVAIVFAVAALVYGAIVFLDRREAQNIAEAVLESQTSGREAALRRALRLIEDRGGHEVSDQALRARLLATITLELGEDQTALTNRILDSMDESGRNHTDARIARTYVALASGRASEAVGLALGGAADSEVGELAYARARAALATRDWETARTYAAAAVARQPSAPRYVALLGLTTSLAGDAASGAAQLDGESLPNPRGEEGLSLESPALGVARARVLFDSGRDPERAAEEARRVLGEPSTDSTPVEKGWAHLVLARHRSARGQRAEAKQSALEAFRLAPPGDESFFLSVAEVLLGIEDAAAAQPVLDALPQTITDSERRSLARAEVALVRGDLAAQEQALEGVGPGAQAAYLRGRLAEARGELAAARAAYREAMADRTQASRATASLAGLHLARGEIARAVALLTPAVRQQPNDAKTVPLLVTALLRRPDARNLRRARAVAQTALQAAPETPELQLAGAEVSAASGDYDAALNAIRQIVSQHPDRIDVRRRLAPIATEAGDYSIGREAFAAVLEEHPADRNAAIGLAEASLRAGSVEDATAAIDAIASQDPNSEGLVELRARLAVLRGDGARAADPLRILVERDPTVGMLVTLGRLLFQAEEDDGAVEAYERALELDRRNPWALLGSAELRIRAGALRVARRSLQAARRSGASRRLGRDFQIRVDLAEARLLLAAGDREGARSKARAALEHEPKWADAHFVLAEAAASAREDPVPHLRSALDAPATPPRALARLALRLGEDEGCVLGRKYRQRAPRGGLADDVMALLARCR